MSLLSRIVNLATGIRGILATTNGGTGTATGSIAAPGAVTIGSGANGNVIFAPHGTGITTTAGRLTITLANSGAGASSSSTTGALVVTGGVGIGGNLNVGGNTVLSNCQVSQTGFFAVHTDTYLTRSSAGVMDVRNSSFTSQIPLLATRLVSASGTTPATLTALQNSTVFTNEGATALQVRNLPTAVAGLTYTFVVQDTDGIQVVAAAGDTIRVAASVSAAAGNIQSTTIGDVVTLVAINATEWVAVSVVGTWTVT